MRFTFQIMLFCISFLLLFQPSHVFAESKVDVKVGDKVPNFTLEGSDGKQYELEKMTGKVVVLVIGSRKLNDEEDRWFNKLFNAFESEIEGEESKINIFEVADMRGIPFFITKGFVRGKVKESAKDKKFMMLLDWDQKVNKLLGAYKDKVDIFVIGKRGILIHHQVVPYSEENFLTLKGKIEEALKIKK